MKPTVLYLLSNPKSLPQLARCLHNFGYAAHRRTVHHVLRKLIRAGEVKRIPATHEAQLDSLGRRQNTHAYIVNNPKSEIGRD